MLPKRHPRQFETAFLRRIQSKDKVNMRFYAKNNVMSRFQKVVVPDSIRSFFLSSSMLTCPKTSNTTFLDNVLVRLDHVTIVSSMRIHSVNGRSKIDLVSKKEKGEKNWTKYTRAVIMTSQPCDM